MPKPFDELKLTGNLPSPTGVGMAILKLTQKDDFTAEDLARTIQSDPALTGRIVKMANSAQSAGVKPTTTVSDAVVRLGVRTVRNVALGFSLVSGYREGKCKNFDYGRYWSLSLARAVSAQVLARELKALVPAEAYIAGLLSGIGRLALATVHPQSYGEVVGRVAGESEAKLAEAERAAFEIDHFEVAEAMLADWKLPDSHGKAIRSLPEASAAGANLSGPAAKIWSVLRVGSGLADVLVAPNESHPAAWLAAEPLRALLGIDADRLAGLGDLALAEWTEWGRALGIATAKVPPFREIAKRSKEAPAESPAAVPGAAAAPAAALASAQPISQLYALVVDDDPVGLKMLVTHLKKAGYRVEQAVNGKLALQIALETNPHVVVTDWMMPEMDGLELCRNLRRIEIGREMYVILLTGREEEDRVVEAFEAGVDDYVTKPFNPRILLKRVEAGERVVRLRDELSRDKKKMAEQVAELAILNRKIQHQSVTDALTGLPNRRFAMSYLEDSWKQVASGQISTVSVIMVDLDHFKRVNDQHGHDAGDEVLRQVATVLSTQLRKCDVMCRLGGEEFLAICPGSDLGAATLVAERLRKAVETHRIVFKTFDRSVTCSLGIGERTRSMQTPEDLMKAADVAVYQAKEGGRNRVCAATAATPVAV